MAKRVTIMINEEIDRKIRQIQAKYISKHNSSFSYSKTIDKILRKGLKLI